MHPVGCNPICRAFLLRYRIERGRGRDHAFHQVRRAHHIPHIICAHTLFTSTLISPRIHDLLFIYSLLLFSPHSLQRLRQELNKLMIAQANKMKDATQRAVFMSTMCERLLRMISVSRQKLLSFHFKLHNLIQFFFEGG
jgi:hypothetical protein